MLKSGHKTFLTLETQKNRNDPGRFFGDGVTFKAKLIGILEVGEARGDRMCQEALQDLKMAIRAAGEHKQRITIHVTIDGLRLRDEKTGDSLYHHPVHKISFIAQDMTDSRAFGYIFGSPDSGHRFFGIKTDKAASQVVLAMRDLFQVVFELKKKEIELARQQIQSKSVHDHQPMPLLISSGNKSNSNDSTPNLLNNKNSDGAKTMNKEANLMSPESVADLVDLEQELSSIQRGITQMERITPSEPTPTSKNFGEEDPFGDSFTNFPTYNLLPPPESSRSRHSKPTKPPDNMNASIESSITNNLTNPSRTQSPPLSTLLNSSNTTTSNLTTNIETSENWLTELENVDVFKSETANATKNLENITNSVKNNDETQITSLPIQIAKSGCDEDDYLAPLPTGRSEVPPIIAPPPQSNKSGRPRRQEIVETKNYDTNQVNKQTSNLPLNPIEFEPEAILPDITLSQLLTLGVEDLAKKLNVPASKLSTMTLVELTTYLSEFIEASKKRQQQQLQEIQTQQLQQNQQQHQKISAPISSKPAVNKAIGTNISLGSSPPIFKVNFDQNSDATFIAKFDDNFGDESSLNQSSTFVANFSQFENIKPESMASSAVFASGSGSLQNYAPPVKSIPPADRYAVFREIIDQDLKNDSSTEIKSSPEEEDEEFYDDDEENSSPIQQQKLDNEYSDDEKMQTVSVTQPIQTKIIDTKITEAISHAKDRYAALRDIILVENLFEKPKTLPQHSDSFSGFTATFGENNFTEPSQVKPSETIFADDSFPTNFETALDEMTNRDESTENDVENDKGESNIQAELEDKDHLEERLPSTGSSPDSNQNYDSDKLKGEDSELHKPEDNILDLQKENGNTSSLMQTLNVSSNKDDVEIDELMNRAISNLSLDSRDHLSPKTPAIIKSPIINDNIELASSPVNQLQSDRQQIKSPLNNVVLSSKFNDVSTSPIPIQKSPQTVPGILSVSDVAKNIEKSPSQLTINSSTAKSPSLKSPLSRSPMGQQNISNGAMNIKKKTSKEESSEWAVFDKSSETRENSSAPGTIGQSQPQRSKGSKTPAAKDVVGESPCSSDGKDDWKTAGINRQGLPPESICSNKRWPKGQTSSSSRDLSPWDDEAPNEYKKRQVVHPIPDRHGYYMRHSRRMNSCDDDYEYEEEMAKRRERKIKSGISKSRDNFDFDSPSWYQSGTMHHSWSPQDDDDRERSFERGVYERSSYGGPMYDKHKHVPHSSYDRRIAYDKRGKYYREYCRPTDYEFESYGECPEVKDRKMMYSRRDYENVYDDGGFTRGGIAPDNNNTVGRNSGSGIYKSREYFYSGTTERRSFDRESIDSYESGGRRRKSFGSGDVYGSFDSREDFRERYMADKTRQIRKGIKPRGPASLSGGPPDEYEQDSETDMQVRREPREYSRSLQRPSSGSRIRKSSGSSPWDGEEGPTHAQKGHWKRPASASESERRLTAENRRVLSHNQSGGSDGEKERRFRKKQRQRGKEGSEIRPSLPTGRYPSAGSHRENYDYVYDDYERNVTTQSPIPGPPVDEDKFERLNRRRMDLNQRMIDMEHRKRNTSGSVTAEKYSYEDEDYEDDDDDAEATKSAPIQKYSMSKKDSYYSEKDIRYSRTPKFGSERFDFDADFEETPHSTSSGRNKFNFDDQVGFESDFISSPPPSGQLPPSATSSIATKTPISAGTKSSFRFSNDFSGKQSLSSNFGDGEFPNSNSTSSMQQVTPTTASTQKLRFDDKVTISKFDHNQPSSSSGGVGNISSSIGDAFEDDDFSKAQFDFENESQWSSETPIKRNNNLRSSGKNRGGINSNSAIDSTTQHDHLRKSESVNIFAKKTEDPFEDDDFFKNVENNSISHDSSNGKKHGNIEVSLSNGGSNINNGNNNMTNTCKKDSFQWDNDFAKFDENM
ncbi:protein disabled isoform X6 [Condylostylus longicornis]|uniref:protein disabled isoform X6 n=1 Tax=Condylostylus longicornis TaxID=2530218 RepID=UPI00244DFCA9|nr:protein disabled isoform X6 [Condylostylus longicornis]